MISQEEKQKQVKAIRDALEACSVGDVPDKALGILSILALNGWTIVKKGNSDD